MSDTIFGGPWIMKARLDQNIWVGSQSLLHQLGFEPATRRNEINMLGTREGSTGVAFPPPLPIDFNKLFAFAVHPALIAH